MTQKEKRILIKDNLKLVWHYEKDNLYMELRLEGEVISKLPFEQY